MSAVQRVSELESLTGLRGFAAVAVCLVHYSTFGTDYFLYPFLSRGYWGVFVFFVLSGFILSYVYQRWFVCGVNRDSYLRFFKLRLIRIYPMHLMTLLAVLVLMSTTLMQYGGNSNLFTLALNLLLLQIWGFTNALSWNQVSWSISAEAFCYLFFPFCLIATRKASSGPILLLFMACIAAIALQIYKAAINAIFSILHMKMGAIGFGGYGICLSDCFLMFLCGMLVFFYIKDKRFSETQADLCVLAGVLIMYFVCMTNMPHISSTNALVTVAAALIICGLYWQGRLSNRIFGNRIAAFCGTISYSLYMVHGLFKSTYQSLQNIFQLPFCWQDFPLPVQLGLVLAFSTAVHYLLDQPIRTFLRRSIAPTLPAGQKPVEMRESSLVG